MLGLISEQPSRNIYYVYFDAVLERELEEDTYDNCYKFFERKSSIKNVVIGPHVKSVPNGLFYNCSHIQRVEIMEGVEYVNSQVFDYVTDMTYLSLPESLVAFESGTFPWNIFGKDKLTNYYKKGFYLGKPSNPYFALVRTDDYDEMGTGEEFELHPDCRELLTLPQDFDAGDTYTFPDQLTALSGSITYYGFDSTTEIIVPDSVVYLESDFGGLYSLKSITFGTGITEVNTNSLCEYDEELESVTFNGDVVNLRPVGDESYYMFEECYSLNEFHILTRSLRNLSIGFNGYDCLYDVENNLTTYGNGVYYGDDDNPYAILAKPVDSSIENITVHEDCKIIGKYAFYECCDLTTVEFEEGCSVFNFENGAFYRDDHLANITLPDTLEILGSQAFYECTSLTEIEIPSSTYYIGQCPFYETNITELEIPNTVKHLGWGVCYTMKKLETVVINADVEYLPRSCFYDNYKLVNVTLNNKIRQIREEAFAYCRLLESVTLPSNTVSISKKAFYRNEVLQTIECPKYLGVIREDAFRECGNLASIGINNRLRNVEKNAFNGCNHLSVIIYRGSVSERIRWLTVDSNAGMMNVSSWHYTNYII